MNGSNRRAGTFAMVAAVLLGTFGCEWDEKTDARYDKWEKAVKDTIEQASKEKEKCNSRPDATSKQTCYAQWDALLQDLMKARVAGAAAYVRCDGGALDRILETVESLIKAAETFAGKKNPFAPGLGQSNFADPLDGSLVDVSIHGTEVFRDGQRHVYQLGGQVSVDWGNGAVDGYPAAGQIVLDVVATPGLAHCTLIDLDLILDFGDDMTCPADGHATDDPTNPTVFDLPLQPGIGYDGRLCGWLDYALENWSLAGSYSTVLPVRIDPTLRQITIDTPPGTPSVAIFPEDPAPTGPYIYYASFSTDVRIGADATIDFAGVEPLAIVDFYGSPKMSHPTGAFQGAAWDLNQPKQRSAGSSAADAAGEGSRTFHVPNKQSLVGKRFFFQGLAHESGGNRSTIAFSAPILP